MSTQFAYRPDIDGLRSVAILAVVLYHAGLSFIPGGFVGVDVFFVISGFLITNIIYRKIKNEKFSFFEFYDKRIRRIFPAFFVLLLFSVIASYFILMPTEYEDFGGSLISSVMFSGNIYFWRTANYFDLGSDYKPLLHMWSLGVEEQFYILFPVVMIAVMRWLRPWLGLIIWVGAAASLALCLVAVEWAPGGAFYLMPARAWQLLIGAGLAVAPPPQLSTRLAREGAAALGILLILGAMTLIDGGDPYPGVNAMAPTLGAALLIHAGAQGGALLTRILSTRPAVFIGLISYSLYLWHWPIFVFYKYVKIYPLVLAEQIMLILAAIAVATMSWWFIERPFRGQGAVVDRRGAFRASAAVMAASVLIGAHALWSGGWPSRLSPEVARLANYATDSNPHFKDCAAGPGRERNAQTPCLIGEGPATVALWGDSHSDAVAPGVVDAAAMQGRAVIHFNYPACRPVLGVYDSRRGDADCAEYNDGVIQTLAAAPEIEIVILAARLITLSEGKDGSIGPDEVAEPPTIARQPGVALSAPDARALTQERLTETVDRLVAMGKTVVISGSIPEIGFHLPQTVARLQRMGVEPESFTTSRAVFDRRRAFTEGLIDALIARHPGRVFRADLVARLCDPARCVVMADGAPLYRDDDHLSAHGARHVAGVYADALARATAGGAP